MIDYKLYLKSSKSSENNDGRMLVLTVPTDFDWDTHKEEMIDKLLELTNKV